MFREVAAITGFVSVTKRFAILASIGVPLLLAAAVLPTPLVILVFWLYNLILFGLLAMDFLLSPKASSFRITRLDEGAKLSHRASNRIAFSVYNPSPYLLQVQADDSVSDRHFAVSRKNLLHSIAPGSEKTFTYNVVPSKRGAFTFPCIHLKVRGLLGLGFKYYSYKCPAEFKVYPNLQDLRRFRLMMRKNRLLPRGDRAIRLFGAGTEFESLRPYAEGDDYRKINWPVTAREMRLIVNDYQVEKNQPVFLMIDGGRPMSYSTGGDKKLDYAINAALVLSDIVNQQGDQSGLLVFDTQVRSLIAPGKGESHRESLMEALYHVEDTKSTSNYGAAFRMLCQRQKRRSVVFIFTDFETMEEAEELTAHIAMLRRRHFPIVVFMKNEELADLDRHSDSYVREVARSFLQERQQMFRKLNALSVPNIETTAEEFSLAVVNRYLTLTRA